jgi:hypothetical protein
MNRQSDNRHHQIITVRFSSIPHARIHVGLVRKFISMGLVKTGRGVYEAVRGTAAASLTEAG